jgi:TolB-like protein/Tfp pilus assembly protein PilF
VDRDLETICAKCLEREPGARYRSAVDLSNDLERWLDGRPILSRPVSLPTRALRWSRRNPAIAAMVVLLLVLGTAVGIMAWKSELLHRPTTNGIAVLPFENLSNDKADSAFADGIQDDLLTKLARIADLKVISRTSVMQYRGKQDMHEIGKVLRVSHVLEGSVRKTGGQVHINAQLIDTRSDTHVWANEYDLNLNDVFAIQSDIAQAVAEQLHAKISTAEQGAIHRPPTVDLTAFDLYSRAKSILLTVSFTSEKRTNLLKAAALLNQAIARDPSFFDAHCQFAWVHDYLYFDGYDHTPARLALAETAIEAAFHLRPHAGEAHLARAWNLYWGYFDYEDALAELESARMTLPNDPQLCLLAGAIRRRQGRHEEALRNFQRAIELDPRNFFFLQQAANSYQLLRRYAEQEATLDRMLAIVPDDPETKVVRGLAEAEWKAEIGPLHRAIDAVRGTNPTAMRTIADVWLYCALAERDAGAAKDALIAEGENPINLRGEDVYLNRLLMEGVIARMSKDNERARSAFAAARAEQEKVIQAQPNFGPAWCVLGLIDAALSRNEDALREGWRAVELLPVEKDALRGPVMIKYLAVIAAWAGDNNLACQQLANALHHPIAPSYGELKLLPFWDPLRGDPRFEKIVASLAPQ